MQHQFGELRAAAVQAFRGRRLSAGPAQFANYDAEIPAVEMRVLVREDVGLDVAERRFGEAWRATGSLHEETCP